jgi:hypothetical protein
MCVDERPKGGFVSHSHLLTFLDEVVVLGRSLDWAHSAVHIARWGRPFSTNRSPSARHPLAA